MRKPSPANNQAIIIIDGFSTGKELVSVIRNKVDVGLIHVITKGCLYDLNKQGISYHIEAEHSLYDLEIIYDNDFDALYQLLKQYHIINTVAGCEGPGVILNEQLQHHLKINHNDFSKLTSRRDKHAMNLCVAQAGLDTINEVTVHSVQEIDNIYQYFIGAPAIVKPLSSAGSEGFNVCQNSQALKNAISNLLDTYNTYGEKNSQVLIQQYINGTEYCINTVSSSSDKRLVTDVWRYDNEISPDGRRLCWSSTLVSEYPESIIKYAHSVLDALGFFYGASHTEVMLTDDNHPILIESAARLMGGLPNSLMRECLKTTQLDLLCELIIGNDDWHSLSVGVKQHIKIVNLIHNQSSKRLLDIQALDSLKKLPSYRNIKLNVKPGQIIPKTSHIDECLGHVVLMHQSIQQINHDEQILRNIQYDIFKTTDIR